MLIGGGPVSPPGRGGDGPPPRGALGLFIAALELDHLPR